VTVATEPLLLIAASGLAREALAALRAGVAFHAVGILDDDPQLHGTTVGGVGVLGPIEMSMTYGDVRLVVCAGSGGAREAIVSRLRGLGLGDERYATILHPSVTMAPDCGVGAGSVLLANAALTADVTVGSHVVGMPNTTITHDDVVEDFVTLCAGVSLGGRVRIRRGAYLGMNSSVRQRVTVGRRCTVGMGAVVLTDVPDGSTVVGNPARELPRRTIIGVQRSGLSSGGVGKKEGR
jgi:sugar O-acyltransferase (sialic acid O-acetyltransferase NeuD family)